MKRLAVLLLLWPTSLWADGPRIEAPASVDAGRLVRVKVTGEFDSAAFVVEPEESADSESTADGKGLVFTGTPGRYVVRAVTLSGKQLSWLRAVVVIGGTPTPVPPTPTPPVPVPVPVPPVPVVGTLHVSLVFDPDSMTAPLAAIRQGAAIRPALASLDAAYRTYAGNSPELARLNLAGVATKAGTPCLIVQDAAGHVAYAGPVPEDEAGVIARVKGVRAGR